MVLDRTRAEGRLSNLQEIDAFAEQEQIDVLPEPEHHDVIATGSERAMRR